MGSHTFVSKAELLQPADSAWRAAYGRGSGVRLLVFQSRGQRSQQQKPISLERQSKVLTGNWRTPLKCTFLKTIFVYVFFGCAGPRRQCGLFSRCGTWGPSSGLWRPGFSCLESRGLEGSRAKGAMVLQAPEGRRTSRGTKASLLHSN